MESGSESSERTANQSKPQRCVRYEILIPTHDTDGNPFPYKLFAVTGAQLTKLIGDFTIGSVNLGTWTMGDGHVAVDETIPFIVDVPIEKKEAITKALIKFKETLAKRFNQEEVLDLFEKDGQFN